MALVGCEECGGTVSTKANSCPHCGCPVESIFTPDPKTEPLDESNTEVAVVECPHCESNYQVYKEQVGSMVTCPTCQTAIVCNDMMMDHLCSRPHKTNPSTQVNDVEKPTKGSWTKRTFRFFAMITVIASIASAFSGAEAFASKFVGFSLCSLIITGIVAIFERLKKGAT